MENEILAKRDKLNSILEEMGSCAIGFSGGADSTFLFAVAHEILGAKALGVTATSETYPVRELKEAEKLARRIGGRHRIVRSEELDLPGFSENRPDRCYHCKKGLFSVLFQVAEEEGISFVADGSNLDDRDDYRPGREAAKELGVRSPLDEAGLAKADIRELSRMMNLPTWDKPALACLSSRIPYGTRITRENLRQVGRVEEGLRALGFKVVRVRHHGDVARIELGLDELGLAANQMRDKVAALVKASGFTYAALDLEGYRTGSMNETLSEPEKRRS